MTSSQQDTRLVCPECGYNLTALTTARCPECGAGFAIADERGQVAPPVSAAQRVSQVLWVLGTAVIILSWADVVSARIGWIGFCVALLGSVISLRGRQ